MPNNSYGLTYPDGNAAANGPDAVRVLADAAGPYTNMRFANAAARDVLLTAPVEGMICWLNDLNYRTVYDGTVWLPVGGATQTYTPVWTATGTAPALGSGTLTGRWQQVGKIVTCYIELLAAAGTTFGTGGWSLTLPVGARASQRIGITGMATDISAGARYISYLYWLGPSSVGAASYHSVSGSSIATAAIDVNSPIPWASGDSLVFQGTYEAA
jgi:hypothetical protein